MIKAYGPHQTSPADCVYERFVTRKGVTVFGIPYQSPRLRTLYRKSCTREAQGQRARRPPIVQVAINPTDLGTAVVRYPDGLTEIVPSPYSGAHGLDLVEQRAALRAARAYDTKPSLELLLLRNRRTQTQRTRVGGMISHRPRRRSKGCSSWSRTRKTE